MSLKEKNNISHAVKTLHAGGIVAYPTETVYGLGCDPFQEGAFLKLKKIKGRDDDKPMLLIASSIDQVKQITKSFDGLAADLAKRFWPGPLTMILQPSEWLPHYLTGPGGGIAIRITPDHTAMAIVSEFGSPVVSTSANKAGMPTAMTIREVQTMFGDTIDYYIGSDAQLKGLPSTIVDVMSGSIKVLRKGAVPINMLEDMI